MGLYINNSPAGPLPARGKVKFLLENVPGTELIEQPMFWRPNLVCVVDNGGLFDAAGFCDTPQEFREWSDPRDPRKKVWLVMFDAYKWAL